jgi:Raf kinase inhibitor-like YbhB/YbcL family protein
MLEVLAVLALTGAMAGATDDGTRGTLPPRPAPSPVDSILDRPPTPFRVASTSFAADEEIPAKHTCEGGDISPALAWSGVPEGTKSFALIVDDPDAPDPTAPKTVWVHWVAYNIPAAVHSIPEGVKPGELPKGARDGVNDWRKPGYSGPCPPTGRHRYYFKVYALDVALADLERPTKARLLEAMKGHVLAESELVGTYEKKAKTIGMNAIGGTPGRHATSHERK